MLLRLWGFSMLVMQAWLLHYDVSGISKFYLFSRDADIVIDIVMLVFWAYITFRNGNNNKVNYD